MGIMNIESLSEGENVTRSCSISTLICIGYSLVEIKRPLDTGGLLVEMKRPFFFCS